MDERNRILYIVIPCFNEEEILQETAGRLRLKMKNLTEKGLVSHNSRIYFVNDGSEDKTWDRIKQLHEEDCIFNGMSLRGNSGQQNALFAGMMAVKDKADMIITMDADLQDDPDAIEAMVKEYYRGNDIVYGVRRSRKEDSIFKKISAQSFYRLINMLGGKLIYNHADCRLMSRRAVEALSAFQEDRPFLRGLIPILNFPSSAVYYDRKKRNAGKSKYSLIKMIEFALEGLLSVSVRPLRMPGILGAVLCLGAAVAPLHKKMAKGIGAKEKEIQAVVWGSTGIQLLAMGVLGEYLGRIYMDGKRRPRYFVEECLRG